MTTVCDKTVVLGPYVSRRKAASIITDGVESTGCVIEFAPQSEGYALEVFRCGRYPFERRDFGAYAVREMDVPFGIQCWSFQVKDLHGGPYIAVSAFLSEMYSLYTGLTNVRAFFQDFADFLPFASLLARTDLSDYPLCSDVAKQGYRVGHVMSYGRRLLVDFAWLAEPSDATKERSHVFAGGCDFRPLPDKSLGPGTWLQPRTHSVEALLFAELRSRAKTTPCSIFTSEAQSRLLDRFEWTPLALMTAKEARQARIDFVKQNSVLANDPKQLARALKAARLYSEDTGVSQIRKFLPNLLKAADLFPA